MLAVHALLRFSKLGKAMRAYRREPVAGSTLAFAPTGWSHHLLISVRCAASAARVFAMDAGSFGPRVRTCFLVADPGRCFLGGPGQAYGAMLGASGHRGRHRGQGRLI